MSIFYPDEDELDGVVQGSSLGGEPDGTTHKIGVIECDGHLILRIELQGSQKPINLLFNDKQAIKFCEGVQGALGQLRR
jgi:hypothetical protein